MLADEQQSTRSYVYFHRHQFHCFLLEFFVDVVAVAVDRFFYGAQILFNEYNFRKWLQMCSILGNWDRPKKAKKKRKKKLRTNQ